MRVARSTSAVGRGGPGFDQRIRSRKSAGAGRAWSQSLSSLGLDVRRELSQAPENFLAQFFAFLVPVEVSAQETSRRFLGIGLGINAFATERFPLFK